MSPATPLLLKLRHGTELDESDIRKLTEICASARLVDAYQDLIREGDRPDNVQLIVEGFAIRYKLLDNGSRQIIAMMLPGDFCDLHITTLGAMDHCIGTLTRCRVAEISKRDIAGLVEYPNILKGFWWASLVDEAVLREWLVSMGQRNAEQRMAHLLCEMFVRLSLIGQVEQDAFELPLTQQDLGDTLGLSTVHINRTMQNLRVSGLIGGKRTRFHIPDAHRLFSFAGFNANYLHLIKRSTEEKLP